MSAALRYAHLRLCGQPLMNTTHQLVLLFWHQRPPLGRFIGAFVLLQHHMGSDEESKRSITMHILDCPLTIVVTGSREVQFLARRPAHLQAVLGRLPIVSALSRGDRRAHNAGCSRGLANRVDLMGSLPSPDVCHGCLPAARLYLIRLCFFAELSRQATYCSQ